MSKSRLVLKNKCFVLFLVYGVQCVYVFRHVHLCVCGEGGREGERERERERESERASMYALLLSFILPKGNKNGEKLKNNCKWHLHNVHVHIPSMKSIQHDNIGYLK